MAYKNKIISNPYTGQSIRFLQTSSDTEGELLEMETRYAPLSKEPPEHYHPYQEEDFLVISGEVTVKLNGKNLVLRTGERLHVPPKARHAMWNSSGSESLVQWKVKPAMNTEHMMETMMGLAADGKTRNGIPTLLQASMILPSYERVWRSARPPFFIQRLLLRALQPLAWIRGHRKPGKQYFD